MPSRQFGHGYRFGFNGKEQDNEVEGKGNIYDYGFRIYNPLTGKFLSVDPLAKSYPWYSPYHFAGNKPIWAIDLDGKEEFFVFEKVNDGKVTSVSIERNPNFNVRDGLIHKHCNSNTERGSAQYIISNEHGEESYSKVYSTSEFKKTYEYTSNADPVTGYDGKTYSNSFESLGQKFDDAKTPRRSIESGASKSYSVLFNTNSDKLSAKEEADIDKQVDVTARLLKGDENSTVVIEGNTSKSGSLETNQALSQRRADYVRQKLIDKGINADRITAIGNGSSAAKGGEGSDNAEDRNVTFKVNKTAPASTNNKCGD